MKRHTNYYMRCLLSIVVVLLACGQSPTSIAEDKTNYDGTVQGRVIMANRYPEYKLSADLYIESDGYIDTVATGPINEFVFQNVPKQNFILRAHSYMGRNFENNYTFGELDTLEVIVALENRQNNDPGFIDVGFREAASIEEVVFLMSEVDLEIEIVTGFRFITGLPSDSTELIEGYLDSKDYIKSFHTTIQDSILIISCTFQNPNINDMSDWGITVSSLDLSPYPSNFIGGIVRTEVGKEIYWIEELWGNPLITFLWLLFQPIE